MRILATLILFAGLLGGFPFATSASAEKRVALVIGNSQYRNVPELANPKNDASDIAAKLESLGFEVIKGLDLDLAGMRKAARDFTSRLEGAELALFFYAGHGLQVNGVNYMAPVDASLRTYDDLDYDVLPMDLVLSAMERKSKVNLIFLDACRDNPLAENLARSMGSRSTAVGRGLARLGSGVGTLISLATQPGNIALDGKGRNSPFTGALLKHLGTPGQSVTEDLILVRRDVLKETGGRQVPWDHSSLTGEVALKEKPAEAPQQAAGAAEPPSAPKDNSLDLAYWESIKDSGDSSYFEAYLKQFPKGVFAGLARLEIAKLAPKAAKQDREPSPKAEEKPAEPTLMASLAPEAAPAIDPEELTRSVQSELNRIGCSVGTVDGKWGQASTRALKDYAGRRGVKLDAAVPDPQILEQLKATRVRVCPIVCGKGMEERGGRCEKIERKASVETRPQPQVKEAVVPPEAATPPRKTAQSIPAGKDCYVCNYMGRQAKTCLDKGRPFTMNDFPITTGGGTPSLSVCKKL